MTSFIEQIKKNWILLAFVASNIVWYANMSFRMNAVEATNNQQDADISQISEIKTDIAVMSETLGSVREDVSFIKNHLD